MTCDEERPCQRCIKREIGHLCHDERKPKSAQKTTSIPIVTGNSVNLTPFSAVTPYQNPLPNPALIWPINVPTQSTNLNIYQPETLGNEFSMLTDFLDTFNKSTFFTPPPPVTPSLIPILPDPIDHPQISYDSDAFMNNTSQSSSPLPQRDVPSCPSLYKDYLCQSFNIEYSSEVIDFTKYIDRHRFIAAGGSGEVWEASWMGIDRHNSCPKRPHNAMPMVVVKLVRVPPLGDEVSKDKRYKRIKRELELWSKLDHPHILPLIGIPRIEGDANLPAFISPWMENGNVMDFLKKNLFCHGSRFLKDIIKGLHYLHTFNPVIVHGDIKGANVLINNRQEAYLSDFGLSRFVVDNTLWRTTATHANGTLRWMAPELIEEEIVTATILSDVYSFGMTCYEILSRKAPFGTTNDAAVLRKLIYGQRPNRVESCHDEQIWDIITRCWAQKPEDRPSTEKTLNLVLKYNVSS